MNGFDPILDREYQQYLAEQAAEKERERIASLPKYAIGTEDGIQYRHFQGRELENHPLPNKWPENPTKKDKDWIYKAMSGYQYFQRVPMEVLYYKEALEEIQRKRNGEIKTILSKSDFENLGVKMSFK